MKPSQAKFRLKSFWNLTPGKHAQKVTWVLELVEKLDQVPVQYFKNSKAPMIVLGSSARNWIK